MKEWVRMARFTLFSVSAGLIRREITGILRLRYEHAEIRCLPAFFREEELEGSIS